MAENSPVVESITPELLTTAEAARLVNVGERTLWRWSRCGIAPPPVKIGDRREVLPAHCCATMNLHRQAVAIRKGKVEAVWPIEARGAVF